MNGYRYGERSIFFSYASILFLMIWCCSCTGDLAQQRERRAIEFYEKGLRAMANQNCQEAREFFNRAIQYEPDDNSYLIIQNTYGKEYFPNAKLRELSQQCGDEPQISHQPPPAVPAPPSLSPPPRLTISSPKQSTTLCPYNQEKMLISGQVTDGHGRSVVTVNGTLAPLDRRGFFSAEVRLNPSRNNVIVRAEDEREQYDEKQFEIVRDAASPLQLTIRQGEEIRCSVDSTRGIVKKKCNEISGYVTGGKGRITLTVDGRRVEVRDGNFRTEIPVSPGEHLLAVRARDESGLSAERIVTVIGEEEIAALQLTIAQGDEIRCTLDSTRGIVKKKCNEISGYVSGGKGRIILIVDDKRLETDKDGTFRTEISVEPGEHLLTVRAIDESGLSDKRVIKVIGEEEIRLTIAQEEIRCKIDSTRGIVARKCNEISGSVSGGRGRIRLTVDGNDVSVGTDGRFQTEVAVRAGERSITIRAEDESGIPAEHIVRVIGEIVPAVASRSFDTKGKYYAFIIGINNYRNNIAALRTAVNDAADVEKILKEDYGFETISLIDSQATRNNILNKFNELRVRLSPDDKLLIYYAGHGYFEEATRKSFWLPVDAERNNDTNWIMSEAITSHLSRISAKHILIVSDSCYAGTLVRTPDVELRSGIDRSNYIEKLFGKKARVIISSGGNEPVSDSGGGSNSVFAKGFIKALKEMDKDVFTAEEVFISGNIKEFVAGNANQTPEYSLIRDSGHDGGDFVFIRKR